MGGSKSIKGVFGGQALAEKKHGLHFFNVPPFQCLYVKAFAYKA